jgi:hypothetical protein
MKGLRFEGEGPQEIVLKVEADLGIGWAGFWVMLGLLALAGVKWWP